MEFSYLPHKILISSVRNPSGIDFKNERWCPLVPRNTQRSRLFPAQFQCAAADWDLVLSAIRVWQQADSQIWLSRNW